MNLSPMQLRIIMAIVAVAAFGLTAVVNDTGAIIGLVSVGSSLAGWAGLRRPGDKPPETHPDDLEGQFK